MYTNFYSNPHFFLYISVKPGGLTDRLNTNIQNHLTLWSQLTKFKIE